MIYGDERSGSGRKKTFGLGGGKMKVDGEAKVRGNVRETETDRYLPEDTE